MFYETGKYATSLSIKVKNDGYTYLTETTSDCGITSFGKFIKEDGSDW